MASPAAARPAVELASLRRRLVCMIYEGLLLVGVLFAGFLLPWILVGMVWHFAPPGALSLAHLFLLLGLYFVWLWCRTGQTLAMQTWRLQIVDAISGKPPTLRQALIRYALSWPSLLSLACGVGLGWTAWIDRDRQFPHDRLSGTCVVFDPRKRQEPDIQ